MYNKLEFTIKRIQVRRFNYNKTKRYKYSNLFKMGLFLLETFNSHRTLLISSSILLSRFIKVLSHLGYLLLFLSGLCGHLGFLLRLD